MIKKANLLKAGFKKYDENSYRLVVNQDKPSEFIIEVRIDQQEDNEVLDIGIVYYLYGPLDVEIIIENNSRLSIYRMFGEIQSALLALTRGLSIIKVGDFNE